MMPVWDYLVHIGICVVICEGWCHVRNPLKAWVVQVVRGAPAGPEPFYHGNGKPCFGCQSCLLEFDGDES